MTHSPLYYTALDDGSSKMVNGYNASSPVGTMVLDLVTSNLRANDSLILTSTPDILADTMPPANAESLKVVRYAVQKVSTPFSWALLLTVAVT